ncbi:MAG: hypothetical protein P0S93_06415 [Candidatus Neptunochlamydia sp.]|nr:hypothetical protein [Candidatus Neptunochlamydia sp.]
MEIVGVQKEKSFFHLAYLSMVNGNIVIKGLEKETKTPDFKKDLFVVSGIQSQDLLIRHIETPLRNIKALHKTLPFQLEALIPYSLEDVVIKPIYDIQEKETHALFFTVPKKALEHHIAHFQEDGIDPEWVSTIPMALFRFADFISPDQKDLVVFHIGMKEMQLVSIQDSKILSHITLHMGSQDLSDGDSSVVVPKLKREVDRAFCFLAHKEKESGKRKVLFCGERTKEVESFLKEEETLLTPINIECHRDFDRATVQPYAISIGLAIDALKNDSSSIQFRQEAFISKRSYSSIKRGLLYGGMLSGALFALTLAGLQVFYHKKERALIKQVEGLASYYGKEIPHLSNGIKGSSLEEILTDLNLRLRIPKNGQLIFSNPPLITDLLSFISSHPKLEGIDVKRIDYDLKSYPSIQRPKGQYHPKVRLIFTTKEAKKAREFHDAIIDDENIINREEEIEWKRNGDEYEITFFLQT